MLRPCLFAAALLIPAAAAPAGDAVPTLPGWTNKPLPSGLLGTSTSRRPPADP